MEVLSLAILNTLQFFKNQPRDSKILKFFPQEKNALLLFSKYIHDLIS